MDLGTQFPDLTRGPCPDGLAFHQPCQEDPFRQAAGFGLPVQQFILLLRQFDLQTVLVLLSSRSFPPLAALGTGVSPASAQKISLRYACVIAAGGGGGVSPHGSGAFFFK